MSSFDNPQFEPHQRPLVPDNQVAPGAPEVILPSTPGPIPQRPAPVEDPVWNGWDVLLIAGLTVLALITFQIATAITAWLLLYRRANFMDVLQKPALALLGQFLAYLVIVAFMLMLVEGKYRTPFWRAIRWNWPRSGVTLAGLGALGACTILLDMVGRYLPMPKSTPFDQFFARPTDAYLIAVFAITLGPLFEELLFRGLLYPVLARRLGSMKAVLLTSLLFGLIHYLQYRSLASILIVGLVGAVLTVVRAVTKSVAASFLVHVGYNATLMVLAAVATDGFRHMEKATFTLQP